MVSFGEYARGLRGETQAFRATANRSTVPSSPPTAPIRARITQGTHTGNAGARSFFPGWRLRRGREQEGGRATRRPDSFARRIPQVSGGGRLTDRSRRRLARWRLVPRAARRSQASFRSARIRDAADRREREQRKTVTVLFCDVTGSTALGESTDPEALRALLARYFERMKGIVESHGGTVEKFIGDAVMAVFGVPVAHEDDALRAVRAAAEMREALPELGVRGADRREHGRGRHRDRGTARDGGCGQCRCQAGAGGSTGGGVAGRGDDAAGRGGGRRWSRSSR